MKRTTTTTTTTTITGGTVTTTTMSTLDGGLVIQHQKFQGGNAAGSNEGSAAAVPQPVYQKIKAGRTLGFPITVTQGGTNNKISQHDAILLNCDENPEEYLAKFAYNDKVKIRWMIAGYSAFVAVGTITLKTLKQIDAAPPTRKAAANSGLMLSDGMVTKAIPQPVTSSTAIKTEDIDAQEFEWKDGKWHVCQSANEDSDLVEIVAALSVEDIVAQKVKDAEAKGEVIEIE